MIESLWTGSLLAQNAPAGGAANQLQLFIPLIMVAVVFYFLLLRPQRKEQKQRQHMLDAVKKNDRVVTIGGIYGVVTNVRREADEITLKVDEASNTKLRVTLSSIARVLSESDDDTKAPS